MNIVISESVADEVIDLVQERLPYTAPEFQTAKVRDEIRRVLREEKVCAHRWTIASTKGGHASKLQAVLRCAVCEDERRLDEEIPF